MPAEISEVEVNGARVAEAYFAAQPAWHGLGYVAAEAETSEDVRRKAHLEWDVLTCPLVAELGPDRVERVADRVATYRSDTGKVLGVVGKDYNVVQNRELFDVCDKLVGTGDVRYEAAGALKGGRVVWVLARLGGDGCMVAPGDRTHCYLLGYTGHDGTAAVTFKTTAVRVVCWNTISLADRAIATAGDRDEVRPGIVRISHTGTARFKLDDARRVLNMAAERFDVFTDEARKLASVRIDRAGFEEFLDEMVPLPPVGEPPATRLKVRDRLRELYAKAPQQNLPGIEGTAWAALNAFTHFVDHDFTSRGSDALQRRNNTLYSVWFGRGNEFKRAAHRKALEMFARA